VSRYGENDLRLSIVQVSVKKEAHLKVAALFISDLPIKFAIHANGKLVAEGPMCAYTTVRGIINKPACPAAVNAVVYTIKIVFLGSGTNSIGLGFVSVWTKAAFHKVPAILFFLHCVTASNDETDKNK
jgi:hypothetical protein